MCIHFWWGSILPALNQSKWNIQQTLSVGFDFSTYPPGVAACDHHGTLLLRWWYHGWRWSNNPGLYLLSILVRSPLPYVARGWSIASSPKLTQNQSDDFKTSRIDASPFEMTHGLKCEDFKCKCFCWHWLCCIDIIVSYCIHLFTCRNSNGNKIWAVYGTILPLFWHILQLMTKELKQLPGSMCCYMQWFNPSVLVCLFRWLDDPCFSTRNFMSRVIVSGFSFLWFVFLPGGNSTERVVTNSQMLISDVGQSDLGYIHPKKKWPPMSIHLESLPSSHEACMIGWVCGIRAPRTQSPATGFGWMVGRLDGTG